MSKQDQVTDKAIYKIRLAIQGSDVETARRLIKAQARVNPSAELYLLASKVANNDAQAERLLQKAFRLDPFDEEIEAALQEREVAAAVPRRNSTIGLMPAPRAAAFEPSLLYASQRDRDRLRQPFDKAHGRPCATFFSRLVASFIDWICQWVIGFIVGVIGGLFFGVMPDPNAMSAAAYEEAMIASSIQAYIVTLLIAAVFYVYFLTQRNGQTPGKTVMGIRIVRKDGRPLNVWDALVRSILGYIISAVFLFLGYLWMLWDDEKQTWHDKMTNTIVVKD